MNIIFQPQRRDKALVVAKSSDALTLNGEVLDFSSLPDGATLPVSAIASDWIAGDVTRSADGVLTVPLLLPHGADAPEGTRFPQPMTDVPDGPVALPPYDTATIEPEGIA